MGENEEFTLPKTKYIIVPENRPGLKRKGSSLNQHFFRGKVAVSFRECIASEVCMISHKTWGISVVFSFSFDLTGGPLLQPSFLWKASCRNVHMKKTFYMAAKV